MLNEDDLRPGDVIQDAKGDFWHVHDDGKIWCSEPENRISFEHARSAGPFKYAPGRDPKRDTVQASEEDSVKHEGKWTRADLPSVIKSHAYAGKYFSRLQELEEYMDAMLDHLNEHYPKPEQDKWRAEWVAVNEDLKAARRQEDLADEQWKKWEHKANEWKARADQLRDERDDAVQSCIAVGRERDEWKASAEKAEADRENIAEEFADFRVEVVAEAVKYRESNPQASGDDPAVYVVRESDIAAVEIERDERGWHGPGTTWTERSTSGEVRAHAEGLVRNVARCEAVARAIEAEPTADPIEEKAIAAFKVAWHEADMHGDEGNRTRRGIRAARKVIEGASGE